VLQDERLRPNFPLAFAVCKIFSYVLASEMLKHENSSSSKLMTFYQT